MDYHRVQASCQWGGRRGTQAWQVQQIPPQFRERVSHFHIGVGADVSCQLMSHKSLLGVAGMSRPISENMFLLRYVAGIELAMGSSAHRVGMNEMVGRAPAGMNVFL